MGRKGTYGGSAGGGRSGKKGNITYTRVIPKFLQQLQTPESQGSALDAKREWATAHQGSEKDDVIKRQTRDKKPEQTQEEKINELKKLEKDGFNVVMEEGKTGEDNAIQEDRVDRGVLAKAWKPSAGLKTNTLGIEKKRKKERSVGSAFSVRSRNKLSFANDESDDEDDDDDDD